MYPKSFADPLADQEPLTPFQRLMPAIRKRFGMIPPAEINRIKRLRPEQQEALLDVVVLAGSLDYFLAQIPADPIPPRTSRLGESQPQKAGPPLAAGLGSEGSSSQPPPPDFGEPPLIPRQPEKLAQAIALLTEWRTIARDPLTRKTLKQLLTRFPENNYQAGLWLRRLQEAQVEVSREVVPDSGFSAPSKPVETGRESLAVPTLEPLQSQVGAPQSDVPEAVILPEPLTRIAETPAGLAPPEPIAFLAEREAGEGAEPPEPEPPAVLPQATGTPWEFAAGKVVEVPTRHPFEVELGLWQTTTASPSGSMHLAVTLTLLTEELKFAQGVVRRVPGLPGLENRFLEAIAGFFLAAEQELSCFRLRPPKVLALTAAAEALPVPTLQPFTLTPIWRSQPVGGSRTQGVVLCEVPEGELDFALGVARRVPGFVGLAERLAAAASGFFIAVEAELLAFQPVARVEPAALSVQPMPVDEPELPLFAGNNPAVPPPPASPQVPGLVVPGGETDPVAVLPPAKPEGTAADGLQTEKPNQPPVSASGTHHRRVATPADREFYAAFGALTQRLRAQGKILARIFPTAKYVASHAWQGNTVPQPASFLKILADLAKLPATERKELWPLLEPVLTTYRAAKQASREFGPVAEALTAAETALVPSTGATFPEPALEQVAEPIPEAMVETAAHPSPVEVVPSTHSQSGAPQVPAAPAEILAESAVGAPAKLESNPSQTEIEKDFFASVGSLIQVARKAGGSLAKAFPSSSPVVKHLLRGDNLPQPGSLLRVLRDLTRLPVASRETLWPYLPAVLAAYESLRGQTPEFAEVAAELIVTAKSLAPEPALEAAFQTLVDARKAHFSGPRTVS